MKKFLWLLLALCSISGTHACIWDADTFSHEQSRSKGLAATILSSNAPAPDDPKELRARIDALEVHREETNADWWNNLAGAYLRLNQPAEAVKILEPVEKNFTNNYGIHANLGTAYHLLGRYADAEREIARDLEINPNAHFGLEKYHLALLQYLVRNAKYQLRHVYVDELTVPFLTAHRGRFEDFMTGSVFYAADAKSTNSLSDAESALARMFEIDHTNWDAALEALMNVSTLDDLPDYRKTWDLAADTNFEAGVIYMAQMNPKEPACVTMLGVAAWRKHDYNLAVKAFEKSIALNSPQTGLLRSKIDGLNYYIKSSPTKRRGTSLAESLDAILLFICIVTFIGCFIFGIIRLICRWFSGRK